MDTIVYNNKTIPLKSSGQLERERIDTLLGKAIEHPVVTVTAGAGYGKTQAVSLFLNKTPFRVIWMQLSVLDNHLTKFWEEFIHAMSLLNKETALQLGQFGFPDTPAKFNQFIYILAKEVYTSEQFLLVLDDFHLIQDEIIRNFIEALLSANLENFCIILISRKQLDLPNNTIYPSEDIFHITARDLQFTIEEIESYFRLQDIDLTSKELERIHTYTEGWPFALYLVALSLKKRKTVVSYKLIAGALPLIFEMIEREIFYEYTPEEQNYLIRISLLKSFPEDLLKTLAGNNLDRISEIIKENMFINYIPHTEHYVFHNLFLDFLNEKKILLTDQEMADTYQKVAEWYLAHDKKIDAMIYYNKCDNYQGIWNIMISYGPAVFPRTISDLFINYIDKFPRDFVAKNPMVDVIRAGLLLNNAETQQAKEILLDLKEKLQSEPFTEESRTVMGETYNMLGLISLASRNYEFKDLFKKASECLPNGGTGMMNHLAKPINTKYAIVLSDPAPGELAKMEEALFDAMPYAAKSMNNYGYGFDYLASAEAAYFTGDMKKASANAKEAITRAKDKQVTDVVSSGYFFLMRIAAAKGDYAGITSNLELLREHVGQHQDEQMFDAMLDIAEGWFYVIVGQTGKVASWIMDDALSRKMLAPYVLGMERLIKGNCLLKDEKYYELLAWLGPYEALSRKNGIWLVLLEALISKSIALYRIQEESQAVATFQEAYEIAHGNNLIMQFAHHGNSTRALVHAVEQSKENRIPKEWLNSIYTKANTYAKRLSYINSEYKKENKLSNPMDVKLSKRERDILLNVYQGLTREEIAESLLISTSTVKNTLNNIYSKLGALNSVDAIRIALQMRII